MGVIVLLFNTGVRPAIDAYLEEKSKEIRSYGEYWSASSAGYCMRKLIFERLGVPPVQKDSDARMTRVFEAGHVFHEWVQKITKEAGLSIAQELELQDEELMVRGHIDDLVLLAAFKEKAELEVVLKKARQSGATPFRKKLVLYDYKSRNSKNFEPYAKRPSYYHRMQVGTYMYMIRTNENFQFISKDVDTRSLTEARILSISKDDLRLAEVQYLWDAQLEADVLDYWNTLNKYWADKKLPKCTCADHEGGFMAKEAWNPFYFNGQPCSIELLNKFKEEAQNAKVTRER